MHKASCENTIVYSLDVEIFMDSNGDSIGDFQGLTQRLERLSGLGITSIERIDAMVNPEWRQ